MSDDMRYLHLIEVETDGFILRALPGTGRVVLNDDVFGAFVIDLMQREVVGRIGLPEGVEDFSLSAWHVSADGRWSFGLDRHQKDVALMLDHEALASRAIELPSTMGNPAGTCWFSEEGLELLTSDGLTWGLAPDDSRLRLRDPSEAFTAWAEKAKAQHPDFDSGLMLRTDFGLGRGYFFHVKSETAGIVTFPDGKQRRFGLQDFRGLVDLAGMGARAFVAYDDRVMQIGEDEETIVYETTANERVYGLTSIVLDEVEHLVVLCDLESEKARLHVFVAPRV